MKVIFATIFAFLSCSAMANVYLPDFNYSLTDVTTRGETKETLFTKLNRTVVKTGSSICSNRALIWTYDMKRFQNIDSAKVFLFFTPKNSKIGNKKWWYHVAPVVNENGQAWVIDGGYSGFIKKPLTLGEWQTKFAKTSECKVIQSRDREFFERMFVERAFPEYTPELGAADCYIYIAPGAYWTPATVAQGILQEDSSGRPIRFNRDQYSPSELMQACKEASAGRLGGVFGGSKKKCEEYLGLSF